MLKISKPLEVRLRASMPNGQSAVFTFGNEDGSVNFTYDDGKETQGSLILDDVNIDANKPAWLKWKEKEDWDHSILNPNATFYNSVIRPTVLHGLPRTFGFMLGNTVGKVVDAVPGASTAFSVVTPSRWAGTVGGAVEGKWIAPWSENNQGWSSLIGNEYGEAADVYGDLFLGAKMAKGLNTGIKTSASNLKTYAMSPKPRVYNLALYYGLNGPIVEDILMRPLKTLLAYRGNQYFFTKKGWRDYYRLLHKKAEETREYNLQILENTNDEIYDDYLINKANNILAKTVLNLKKGDAYVKKYGDGSAGVAYWFPDRRRGVSLRITKKGNTMLPLNSTELIVGNAAHEFNHVVQEIGNRFGRYNETVYDPNLKYYTVNKNHSEANSSLKPMSYIGKRPFSKELAAEMSKNSVFPAKVEKWAEYFKNNPKANSGVIKRTVWQSSPNEVFSELTKYRFMNNLPVKLNEELLRDFSYQYAHRFNLIPEELYDIASYANTMGYKKGGKLIPKGLNGLDTKHIFKKEDFDGYV